MNWIIAMLHNVKENRWHPILLRPSPLPSATDDAKVVRYKSKGHHTAGFPDRESALEYARGEEMTSIALQFGELKFCLDKDFPWDGEGVPAIVVFFTRQDGELVPAF